MTLEEGLIRNKLDLDVIFLLTTSRPFASGITLMALDNFTTECFRSEKQRGEGRGREERVILALKETRLSRHKGLRFSGLELKCTF